MSEGQLIKNVLDEIYLENMMLKLFLMENNLICDYTEFINEKTIKFKLFDQDSSKNNESL